MLGAVSEKLEGLGFSPYEAKAYCALLIKSPATGYEVARESGIPSSKVYETLERLVAKGAATTLEGDTLLYMPVPVHTLIDQLKRQAVMLADALEDEIAQLKSPRDILFWNVSGENALWAKAAGLIANAQNEVLLQGWTQDIRRIENELQRAIQRGLKVSGVYFGEGTLAIGNLHRHKGRRGGQLRRERFFMLAVDARLSVTATIGRQTVGCWSGNPAMAVQLSDYLRVQVDRQTGKLVRPIMPRFKSPFGFIRTEHPDLARRRFGLKRRKRPDDNERQ